MMYRLTGIFFLIIVGILCFQTSFAEELPSRISVTDKEIIERLTRLEEGQKALNQRMDDIHGLMWVLLAGMFAIVGFVIWDRKTALSPVVKKAKELEDNDALMLKALKEYARKEPKLAEVLKSLGLL